MIPSLVFGLFTIRAKRCSRAFNECHHHLHSLQKPCAKILNAMPSNRWWILEEAWSISLIRLIAFAGSEILFRLPCIAISTYPTPVALIYGIPRHSYGLELYC
jgi:hypothetical protein